MTMTAMRRLTAASVALVAALIALPAVAAGIPEAAGVPTLAPILAEITPAVVNIAVRAHDAADNPLLKDPAFRRFFGRRHEQGEPQQDPGEQQQEPGDRQLQATGSGVIVDAGRGFILT